LIRRRDKEAATKTDGKKERGGPRALLFLSILSIENGCGNVVEYIC
jgi:hypothetical protein